MYGGRFWCNTKKEYNVWGGCPPVAVAVVVRLGLGEYPAQVFVSPHPLGGATPPVFVPPL